MTHKHAHTRLPDLIFDRDEPELLAHVAACHDCQRQLFLLTRVDRLLRTSAPARRKERRRRRNSRWFRFPAGLVAALLVAAMLLLFLPGHVGSRQFTSRSAAWQPVGRAVVAHADASNLSVSLVARGLPTRTGTMYVLWAGEGAHTATVGHFIVDARGSSRTRFNLPAGHQWGRFRVIPPGDPGDVVAAT
ncbi:MAG TPA: hypothetical protein VFM96_12380 [Gaiellaceae bacterium]|nr:hypothetical protein [Gaiellaceae bacterium]